MSLIYKNISLSKNRLEVNIEAADALIEDRTGLVYYLEVYIPDGYLSQNFKSLVRLQASEVPPYNQSGIMIYEGAYFPIQDYLDSLLDFSAPTFSQTEISVCENLTKIFYLKKTIENNGVEIYSKTTPTEHVLKGGIDDKDFADWKDIVFSNTTGLASKFLSWMPTEKLVQLDQPEYLYWLANAQPMDTNADVLFEILNADGTKSRLTVLCTIESVQFQNVYCIPVSPSLPGIGITEDAQEIIGYNIWIAGAQSGTVYTEKRTYVIDKRYRRNIKHLIFSNSLGGFDTLTLFGRSTETLGVAAEEYERYVPFAAQATYAERIINKITGERLLEINTGYIDKEELRYLQDLMFAKQIYLVTDRDFLPIINTTQAMVHIEDDVYARGRTFTFKYANLEYSYSNLSPAPPSAVRPTEWRVFGVPKCLSDTNGIRTGLGQYPQLQKFYIDNGQPVVPTEIKNNALGTVGYIGPIVVNGCEITPFLSAKYEAQLAFTKNDCNEIISLPTKPIYTVPAQRYGSDISQAEADAKAFADWVAKNNQAGANQVGICRLTAWRGSGSVNCNQDLNGLYTGIGTWSHLERYYLDDNTAVVPVQIKPNVSTDINYIASAVSDACAFTPYVSKAISRNGLMTKNDCNTGYSGTSALINVPAAMFGSAISQADADAKAEAYFVTLDTQAHANAFGECRLSYVNGGLWANWWNIPSGQWLPDNTMLPTPSDYVLNPEASKLFDFGAIDNNDASKRAPAGISLYYFMRAKGQIKLPAGNVTATVVSDDGCKVVINNEVIINEWKNTFSAYDTNWISTGEWVDIEIEHFSNMWTYFFAINNIKVNGSVVVPEFRYLP